MGMGLPMIMTSPKGEATTILENSNSGTIVTPEAPRAVADSIRELYKDRIKLQIMATNSYDAANTYDRKKLALIMLESLEELTG